LCTNRDDERDGKKTGDPSQESDGEVVTTGVQQESAIADMILGQQI